MLRHHLHIESAVSEGARNVIRILQNVKSVDKKQYNEVRTYWSMQLSAPVASVSDTTAIGYWQNIDSE